MSIPPEINTQLTVLGGKCRYTGSCETKSGLERTMHLSVVELYARCTTWVTHSCTVPYIPVLLLLDRIAPDRGSSSICQSSSIRVCISRLEAKSESMPGSATRRLLACCLPAEQQEGTERCCCSWRRRRRRRCAFPSAPRLRLSEPASLPGPAPSRGWSCWTRAGAAALQRGGALLGREAASSGADAKRRAGHASGKEIGQAQSRAAASSSQHRGQQQQQRSAPAPAQRRLLLLAKAAAARSLREERLVSPDDGGALLTSLPPRPPLVAPGGAARILVPASVLLRGSSTLPAAAQRHGNRGEQRAGSAGSRAASGRAIYGSSSLRRGRRASPGRPPRLA